MVWWSKVKAYSVNMDKQYYVISHIINITIITMSETQDECTFTNCSYSELITPGCDQASTPNPHYKLICAPPPCRFSPRRCSQHISYAQDEPSECGGSDSLDEDSSQYELL